MVYRSISKYVKINLKRKWVTYGGRLGAGIAIRPYALLRRLLLDLSDNKKRSYVYLDCLNGDIPIVDLPGPRYAEEKFIENKETRLITSAEEDSLAIEYAERTLYNPGAEYKIEIRKLVERYLNQSNIG